MRTPALALTALLLFPTAALALPPASLTPPLPTNEDVLPLNAVVNGGFEQGLANWKYSGGPGHPSSIVSPGAQGTGNALAVPNGYWAGGYYQSITPPTVRGATLLLDFYAQAAPSTTRTGYSKVEAYSHWNMATGDARLTATVGFNGADLYFLVFDGAFVRVATPDDAWHHYQLLIVGVGERLVGDLPGGLGIGVLLIDGQPQTTRDGAPAIATGTPANVDPATFLYVGEGNYCDCVEGRAPDVTYDEVYLGVQV